MEPTKITARLPGVDVEISKQAFPERNAETMSIHITATPSFEAASRWLLAAALFPLAPAWFAWAGLFQAWRPVDPPGLPDRTSANPLSIK
jgi:hypothetical protein